ncbi:MAG TPA: Hpt domain-containing protein, partial [Ilumatobacteraceae bacterium]|nr:Hpt domain-containing protein [Ilumatobacteraceae bacterium]
MTEAGDRDALRVALAGLWHAHRADIDALVDDLRAAVAAPSEDASQRAQRAAHRLAGSLGTFGLADGTRLARQLETCFAAPAEAATPDVAAAAPLVEQLTAIVSEFDVATPADDAPAPEAAPPRRRAVRTVAVVGFSEPLATAIAEA